MNEVNQLTEARIKAYNNERPHYSLNDMTPAEYRQGAQLLYNDVVLSMGYLHINSSYPKNGTWLFDIQSIVCESSNVVTDVLVTDGVQNDRVITFHTVEHGLIIRQKEFWPDAMPAQEWRKDWVKIALE